MVDSKHITPIAVISMLLVFIVVILAIAYLPGAARQSDESYEPEYISQVFNKDKVMEIEIDINPDDWNWLIENAAKEEYRTCNITINGTTFYNVGIRPKGNSSLKQVAKDDDTDRFSFKVSFDKYVDGQTGYGLSKLALNNIMADKTYMKEYLSYEVMSSLEIPTPACSYCNITVNDQAWGLYLAVEVIDESFLQHYFGDGDYNLYKPDTMDMNDNNDRNQDQLNNRPPDISSPDNLQQAQVEPAQENDNWPAGRPAGGVGNGGGANLVYSGDNLSNYYAILDSAVLDNTNEEDYQKVITMIKNLNAGTNLEEYLDVKEILKYFAANTFLVNLDSYSGGMYHNYYLFEEDGLFQILPWDFNLSFGGMKMQDAQKAVNFPIDKPTTDNAENAPLISKLLEVPEYRELYHQYLQDIVDMVNSGSFAASVNKLDSLINTYVKGDATAFYCYEDYENSLPVLVQFSNERAASIAAQLGGEQPSTSYGNLNTSIDMSALGSMGGNGGAQGGNQAFPPGGNFAGENNQQFQPGNNVPGGDTRLDRSVMSPAMEIIRSATGSELTAEQVIDLQKLGLNDAQIKELWNMKNRASRAGNAAVDPGRSFENQDTDPATSIDNTGIMVDYVLKAGIPFLVLVLALFGISTFERRRYHHTRQ